MASSLAEKRLGELRLWGEQGAGPVWELPALPSSQNDPGIEDIRTSPINRTRNESGPIIQVAQKNNVIVIKK